VLVAGLRLAAALVEPLLLAFFLSVVSYPLVRLLISWHVPRGLSVVLVLVLDVAVVVGFGLLLADVLDHFQARLPAYEIKTQAMFDATITELNRRGAGLDAGRVAALVEPASVVAFAGSLLQSVMNVIGQLFLVLLLAAFLMLEASGFGDKLRKIDSNAEEEMTRFEGAAHEVQKYLGVKTLSNLVAGLVVGGLSHVFHLDFPVLWAVVAFLLNYIPTLGSILASLPPIALALVMHGPGSAALYAALYTALNVLIGNVLEPRVMGKALGLSPLVVLLSMFFWGWLWGPVGALLSVPLTMSAKIALAHTTDLAWVSVLLGRAPAGAELRAPDAPPPVTPPTP
jgi:predicted PurR-regulated permease PerM